MVSVKNAAQIVKLVSVQKNYARVVKILNNLANTVVLAVVKDLPVVRHVQMNPAPDAIKQLNLTRFQIMGNVFAKITHI